MLSCLDLYRSSDGIDEQFENCSRPGDMCQGYRSKWPRLVSTLIEYPWRFQGQPPLQTYSCNLAVVIVVVNLRRCCCRRRRRCCCHRCRHKLHATHFNNNFQVHQKFRSAPHTNILMAIDAILKIHISNGLYHDHKNLLIRLLTTVIRVIRPCLR